MQTETQVIESLQKKAKQDSFIEAAGLVLAMRNRARFQMTIRGLRQRMVAEGYDKFEAHDYARFLDFLASLHLGKTVKNTRGTTIALTGITVSLQSIGKALCGEAVGLERFKKRNRYTKLAETPKVAFLAPPAAPKALVKPASTPMRRKTDMEGNSSVGLAVNLGGRTVRLPIPDNLTAEEVGMIVARFREPKRA